MGPTEELVFANDPIIPKLQPGQSFPSTIRSGSWSVFAEACDSDHVVAGLAPFDISGDIAIAFDKDDTTSPSGYRRMTLQLETTRYAPAGQSEPESSPGGHCLPADAPLPSFDASQCCSGRSYTQHGDAFCAN